MRTAVLLTAFGVGLAFAAPVPKEEEKLKPATDKERNAVKNSLKQIALGLHNFEAAMGYFPGDIVDAKTKKPLLSWRVAVLPYLEGGVGHEVYQEFKLDEPWDSKHNKPLAEKVPKIFAPTRVKARPGETFYRGFADYGLFQCGQRVTLVGIVDWTSNTIGVIDAGEPVVWTRPDTDLPSDPKKDLPKLGGMIDGDFYCVMCDGSVRKVKRDFKVEGLRAAISRAGGEIFDGKDVFADQ